jgi:mono/diheme cytochrome c family protein
MTIMKIHAVTRIILAFVLLSGGQVLPLPVGDDGLSMVSPERGLYIFDAYCVSCHGPGGRGDGPISDSLFLDFGVRPADLSARPFQQSRSDAQLALAVLLGGEGVHKTPNMPAWDTALTEGQVRDLVAFVRQLGAGLPREITSTPSAVVDTLELGRFLYMTRCLACHGPEGRGEGPYPASIVEKEPPLPHPPDLSDYEKYLLTRSDQDLESTINAGFQHTGWPIPESGWRDRPLSRLEARALIFYLRALGIPRIKRYGFAPAWMLTFS